MPHLTLEYSDNLPAPVDFGALFASLHEALVEIGSFRLADLKSRAVPHSCFRVGAGSPESVFVHLTVAIFASNLWFSRVFTRQWILGTHAAMILRNSQQAIRSAKETILDVVGRMLDDALRLETINAYSSLGDFSEARERLAQFYSKTKATKEA